MKQWKHVIAGAVAALAVVASAGPASAWASEGAARTPAQASAGHDRESAQTAAAPAQASARQASKPNILVIWGDDIGTWNISHNNRGMMGYKTPNIDRIAERGRGLHRLLRPAELHGGPRGVHRRLACPCAPA